MLLNGGMGVHTQLKTLNDLLIHQARRTQSALNDDGEEDNDQDHYSSDNDMDDDDESRVLSCDEAIMHLAQLQEATRAGDDEVAFLQLGFGQGVARRARAIDSVDQQIVDSLTPLQFLMRSNVLGWIPFTTAMEACTVCCASIWHERRSGLEPSIRSFTWTSSKSA